VPLRLKIEATPQLFASAAVIMDRQLIKKVPSRHKRVYNSEIKPPMLSSVNIKPFASLLIIQFYTQGQYALETSSLVLAKF
jgi:hypothetical protein